MHFKLNMTIKSIFYYLSHGPLAFSPVSYVYMQSRHINKNAADIPCVVCTKYLLSNICELFILLIKIL